MKIKVNCKLKYYDIMNGIYPSTNDEAVIRAIFIEDKILIRANNLKIWIITLDVT